MERVKLGIVTQYNPCMERVKLGIVRGAAEWYGVRRGYWV